MPAPSAMLCLIISVVVSASADWPHCEEAIKMPRIDAMANGYDIVQGFPSPQNYAGTLGDPGWRNYKIFDIAYDAVPKVSADGCFQVPANVTITVGGACTYKATHQRTEDSSSFQAALSASIEFDESASPFPFLHQKFSASADFNFFDSETSTKDTSYYTAQASCSVYAAVYPPSVLNDPFQPLHPIFVQFVSSYLTAEYDAAKYAEFVKVFGTHYAQGVVMGARASLYSAFSSEKLEEMVKGGFDFEGAVQTDVALELASASEETSAKIGGNAESYQSFNQSRSTFIKSCVGAGGSCPPPNPALDASSSDQNTWIQQTRSDPVPIQYTLNSIDFLLSPTWFPDVPDIKAKQQNLMRYLGEYCTSATTVSKCIPAHSCRTEPMPSMSTKREFSAEAVFDSKLFAIGGEGDDGPLNTVEVFTGSSWAPAPSMSTKRWAFAAAVSDSKLFAIGGVNDDGVLNTVEVFDGSSWSPAPSMSTTRYNFAAAVFDSKLFAIGGEDGSGAEVNTVELFQGESWRTYAKDCTLVNASSASQRKVYADRAWLV